MGGFLGVPVWMLVAGYVLTVVIGLTATILGIAVAFGSRGPRGWRAEIEPAEVGMLTSERLAVLSALTELVTLGLLVVRGDRIFPAGNGRSLSLHPFVSDVMRAAHRPVGIAVREMPSAVSGALVEMRADLVDRGYLRPQLPRWVIIPPLLIAAVGAAGTGTGLLPAAVFVAVSISLAVGVGCCIVVLRTQPSPARNALTRRGVMEYLDGCRRYRYLDPKNRPALALYGPRETAMATALFGPEVIRDIAPALFAEFRTAKPRRQSVARRDITGSNAGWSSGSGAQSGAVCGSVGSDGGSVGSSCGAGSSCGGGGGCGSGGGS